MSLDYLAQLTSKIGEIPKPGLTAQLKMAPPQRFGTKDTLLEVPKNAKKAAVLMLLYPDKNGQINFCLIQRTTYDGKHSGQISFPGGKKEDGDRDFWATALRESQEEVGVDPATIQFITDLSTTYIPPSNFYVYPFIAYTDKRPDFIAEEGEVDHVIEVPLADLLGGSAIQDGPITASYASKVVVPMFVFGEYRVWGATAMILSEAREIIHLAK
ncbi:MAG: CoA pyrophosphatase [Candidatus Arcticimaribacter sp.]